MVYGMCSSLETEILALKKPGPIIAMEDSIPSATALDPAIAAPPTENATAILATGHIPASPISSRNSAGTTYYHT